ncbi:MAG: site-2 protease family protein [Verrucomicrobiota bacterium]
MPAPRDDPDPPPLTRAQRDVYLFFLLTFFALVTIGVVDDFTPGKLAAPFFILSWAILLVIHELGHALMARALGWRVDLISLGFGKVRHTLRWWNMPVEIRTVPVSGFVIPRPLNLTLPKLKNCLIYAAGPGIEILLVLILLVALGKDTMLTRTDSIPVIAAQAFSVAALTGAILNLVPLSHKHSDDPADTSPGNPSDGLGMILAWFLPLSHYQALLDDTPQKDPSQP